MSHFMLLVTGNIHGLQVIFHMSQCAQVTNPIELITGHWLKKMLPEWPSEQFADAIAGAVVGADGYLRRRGGGKVV